MMSEFDSAHSTSDKQINILSLLLHTLHTSRGETRQHFGYFGVTNLHMVVCFKQNVFNNKGVDFPF